ncbi:hypothetical protein [Hymenobacter tenuis]
MKTLIFTLLLLAGFSSSVLAQMKDRYSERPGNGDLTHARVEEVTRMMNKQLRLNEAQYIQLRAVNKIKIARADEIQWEFYDNPSLRSAKLAELEAQYEQECSRILTPSQLSLLRDEQKREVVPVPTDGNEGGLG